MNIKRSFKKNIARVKSFLGRRPHRSFQLTRRRDYKRSLRLPGYIAFTKYVFGIIWKNRKIFLLLSLVFAFLTLVMVGITSEETYSTFTETLRTTSGDLFVGGWGELTKAGLLFVTALTGGMADSLSEAQQIYAGLISLMAWLTSVWLLRNILAGKKIKLRDGLYSAGSPILSTFLVALLLLVQILPFAIALIGYSAALATGLLAGGVEAMLFWAAAGLLVTLSLYWITSTVFALVVVTLPGMYPSVAIKTAGDLVIGRRLRILSRFLWMGLVAVLAWAIIVIPMILFDSWIKGVWPAISWLPFVPITLLTLSSLTIVWVSSYVYLLYRKVVADEASPA